MFEGLHYDNFRAYPVIAAVRTAETFEKALNSDVRVISIVGGDFFQMTENMLRAKEEKKTVLLHMDLIEGIGKDKSGMKFAKDNYGIAGVHSTRGHILKLAAEENLITIQRLFITDFQSITSGLTMVKSSRPDFVEITPAIIPRIIRKIKNEQKRLIIASGLVESAKDVQILQRAGATNVVCSKQALWIQENIMTEGQNNGMK